MTAPIRSMPELIQALRDRRDELDISHSTIDEIAGLQAGYTSKLLAPQPIKNLGPMSFGSILGALGLAVVVVDDPDAMAKMNGRWERRKRPSVYPPLNGSASIPASIENEVPQILQITPELQGKIIDYEHMKRIAKMGAKRRNKVMKKRARQQAASHAARMRWSKQK